MSMEREMLLVSSDTEISSKWLLFLLDITNWESIAVSTYNEILDSIGHCEESKRLNDFRSYHEVALNFWKQEMKVCHSVQEKQMPAEIDSFLYASKILGKRFLLHALKTLEEKILNRYQVFLSDGVGWFTHRERVQSFLIPNQKKHIDTLYVMVRFL